MLQRELVITGLVGSPPKMGVGHTAYLHSKHGGKKWYGWKMFGGEIQFTDTDMG